MVTDETCQTGLKKVTLWFVVTIVMLTVGVLSSPVSQLLVLIMLAFLKVYL